MQNIATTISERVPAFLL